MLNFDSHSIELFESHIRKCDLTNCWEWTAALRDGYGKFTRNGKNYTAHRIAYELEYGEFESSLLPSVQL